jgi:hypothetical protein
MDKKYIHGSLVVDGDILEEFKSKRSELQRRLKSNQFNPDGYELMNDRQQDVFITGIFVDPMQAEGIDNYIEFGYDNCECPDVMDELYEMCPALMSKVDMFKDRRDARTRVTIESLDRLMDEVITEVNDPIVHLRMLLEQVDFGKLLKSGSLSSKWISNFIQKNLKIKPTSAEAKAIQKGFNVARAQVDKRDPEAVLKIMQDIMGKYLLKTVMARQAAVQRRGGKGTAEFGANEILKVRNVFSSKNVEGMDLEEIDGLGGTPARRINLIAKMVEQEKYFTAVVPNKDVLTGKVSELEIQVVLDKDFKDIKKLPLFTKQSDLVTALVKAKVPVPTFGQTINAFADTIAVEKVDDDTAKQILQGGAGAEKGAAAYMALYYVKGNPFTLPVNVEKTKGAIKKYYQDNFGGAAAGDNIFADKEGDEGILIPSLIPITDIVKKAEIGGGAAGTAAEVANMKRFTNRLAEVKIKLGLDNPEDPVDVVILYTDKDGSEKEYMIKGVVTMEQSVGSEKDPKSDLSLRDADDNELFHISHKDGKTAKSAQQWGGISKKSGLADEPAAKIFSTALKDYLKNLKGWGKEDLGAKGDAAAKIIKDKQPFGFLPPLDKDWSKTSMRSFMGPGFEFDTVGQVSTSNQLVDAVIQGEMEVEAKDGKVVLSAHHIFLRKAMEEMTEEEAYNYAFGEEGVGGPAYAPAFFTKNDQGRNDLGIKRARVTIMPAANRIPRTVLVKKGNKFVFEPRSAKNWPSFK